MKRQILVKMKPSELLIAFLLLLFLIGATFAYATEMRFSIQKSCIIAYGFCVVYILFCLFNSKQSIFSPVMIIIHYLFVTGFGVPIAYLFAPEYTGMRLNRSKMFYGIYLDKYILISTVALSSILLAVLLFSQTKRGCEVFLGDSFREGKNYYYEIGLFLLISFAVYCVYGVLTRKIVLFSYSEYKAASNRLLGYLERGYWFGTIFACAAGTKKQIGYAIPWFLLGSIILLLAGNRNDIYFPMLIGMGLYVMRFAKLPRFLVIGVSSLILLSSPILILLRNNGEVTMSELSVFNLLGETFSELGGQVCASSHMFRWLEQGDHYGMGICYVMGVIGSIFYPFHIGVETAISNAGYWIENRTVAIGFSMVAEVFYNFGIFGLGIVFFFIGLYLVIRERKVISDTDELVRTGFLYFWLLYLVRNYFGFSFTYVIMFYAVYFLEKVVRSLFEYQRR